jgi:hypothetical protein
MKSNILTNYQTTPIHNNVFKTSFIDKYFYQNKSVENIPTPNIVEEKSFFRNYRKTILGTTAVFIGGIAIAKLGFPAFIGSAGTKMAMKAVEDIDVSAYIPTNDDKSSYKVDHEFWRRIALFFKSK